MSDFVIVCHVSPDGDAIGSSLGLWHLLLSINKKATIITPDQPPKSLSFLPGISEIISYSSSPEIAKKILFEAEAIICLDFNSLSRIDRLELEFKNITAPKVIIDHHLYPEDFAELKISYPQVSSTCALLYYVIYQMGLSDKLSSNAAECIYTGMMTDTGNFSYNSSDSDLYLIISELIKKGINKDQIYTQIYNTNTESSLRVNGYAISNKMRLFYEQNAALITLNKEELEKHNYQKGDTEGLVNVPLSIPGISFSAFFREDKEFVKISMRSKGDFPVNTICEKYFNGGGHKNAAGGEFYGSLNEAIALFESVLINNKLKQ